MSIVVASSIPEIVPHASHGLPASDRCDRCGAQAYMAAVLTSGQRLLFCAHHADQHYPALVLAARVIDDYRPFLHHQETQRGPQAETPSKK